MDENKEIKNIRNAAFLTTGSGIYTMILAVINPKLTNYMLNPSIMIQESIILLLLTFGLYKKSRICSVLLFVFYLVEVTSRIILNMSWGAMLVITYFVFIGLISVFKYHKYKKTATKDASTDVTAEDNPIHYFEDDKIKNSQNYIYLSPVIIIKTILIIIGIITVITVIGVAILSIEDTSTASSKQEINKEVDNTNTDLPMMIDEDTRLDSIDITSEDNVTYHFTIVTCLKEEIDVDVCNKILRPELVEIIMDSEELKELKHNNYNFTFSYFDKENVHMFDIVITSKEYNNYI